MNGQLTRSDLFLTLPERRAPWIEFVGSLGFESLALLVIFWVGLMHPQVLVPVHPNYTTVELVDPPVSINRQPAPVRVIQPPRIAEVKPEALKLPPETKLKPEIKEPTPAPPKIEALSKPAPLEPKAPVIPRQLVKTNVFSTGSSATPTIARAPQQVQTGGFGDPNGLPARETNGKPVNIAALGSYDLPAGGGYGNGTGGSNGVRGVVASAGFGNGVAVGDGSGRANVTRGTSVRQGAFGDAVPAAAQPRAKAVEAAPKQTPAEIISKPTPVYTAEARKLRIEGEVLLEVVFEGDGTLRIVRVVRGLGHGLDEAAVQAAQQIRFKPASRNGQPTDSTGILHIVFQLV
ncbi:MAG: TonB family protein [Acidobacteriales bacterium]|nr:TonB family protein [Terriglobales bacterium]